MLNPGDQAPSLELNQIGSGQIQIQPDGKPIILAFFATDCETSRMAIPLLNRFATYIAAKGGRVMAISQDNKKQTMPFVEAARCSFPILTDRGLKASLDFDPERVPAFFLLDGYFKVVRRQVSFNKAGLNSIAREMCDMLGAGYEPIGLEHDGVPDFKEGTPARQRDLETIVEDETRYNAEKSAADAAASSDETPAPEPESIPEPSSDEIRLETDLEPEPTSQPIAQAPEPEAIAIPESEPEVVVESELSIALLDLEQPPEPTPEIQPRETIVSQDPEDAPLVLNDEPSAPLESAPVTNGEHADLYEELTPEPEPAVAASSNGSVPEAEAPAVEESVDEEFASDEEIEIGDGLPMIEPSMDQIEAFIAAAHRSRDEVLGSFCKGEMPVTVEFAAQFAARAGCVPEDMRTFSALVSAAGDSIFNLKTIRASKLALEPLIIINGPIRSQLNLNSGAAALSGVSPRALNLGRAFGLLIRTVAAASHVKESKTLGHAGRISFLLAENEEASPWESLAAELGANADAVTLIPSEAPVSFWDSNPGDGMAVLAGLSQLLGSLWNPRLCGIGDAVVALCPAHARAISLAGLNKAAVRRHLFDHAVVSARDAEDAAEAGAADPETEPIILRGQQAWRKFRALDCIRVIVAGSESGETSTIFPAIISPRSGGGIVCANVA